MVRLTRTIALVTKVMVAFGDGADRHRGHRDVRRRVRRRSWPGSARLEHIDGVRLVPAPPARGPENERNPGPSTDPTASRSG